MSAAQARTLSLGQIMNGAPLAVASDALAADAERLAVGRRVHHVLVSFGDLLVGVVCTCVLRAAPAGSLVSDSMKTPGVGIGLQVSIERAAAIMRERALGCLPVLEQGRVVGLVVREDLIALGLLQQMSAGCLWRGRKGNA